ncbi:uncharacterized protein LOC129565619 [Sitodiplosis mosellana]|uniref:uncharacterized protein LOC129565619 n=1 Tax=Sitodiplosis mosellana TaxID=263140 RepID=UPI002443AF33|nr:uncharacterized protein LOC129565619 [Sitodiplosis mosellana]
MLDGWYCRSMANQNATQNNDNDDDNEPNVVDDSDESQEDIPVARLMPRIDYKAQYTALKKKLKFLLYENEFFQDALRSSQRRLLKVTRDRSFLLDRLLQYEKPENSESDSDDDTESSEDDGNRTENVRKRKNSASNATQNKNANPPKRRKQTQKKVGRPSAVINTDTITDGHMTAEEVERHLQSKQSLIGMVPEAPATVPTEMFSNEPSLDSESNLADTSPNSILGEDIGSIELGNTHE